MDLSGTEIVDRDIAAIQFSDWPFRPLGTFLGFRENRFQVIFAQSALDDIHLHGQGAKDIEVCGVLIGGCYRDSQGPYLLIEHCIRGNGAEGKSTNVTFTAETWALIQDQMDRLYAEKKMVGWYHTHPSFGIFLSDMDIFICDNFFNIPWQVAFVYDPVSGEEGNFVWRANRPQREPILIEDDVTALSAKIPLVSVADATRGDAAESGNDLDLATAVMELRIRVRRLERRQKTFIGATVFLAAFIIMWAIKFSAVAVPVPADPATPLTKQPVPVHTDHPPLSH